MKFNSLLLLTLAATAACTSITSCHSHGSEYFCFNTDGVEGQVEPAPTATGVSSYTSCHAHGSDTYCMDGSAEVKFQTLSHEHSGSGTETDHGHSQTHTHASHQTHTPISHQTSVVTGCHSHGTGYMCLDGLGREGQIVPSPTEPASSFTACHSHATETFCLDAHQNEVEFRVDAGNGADHDDGDHEHGDHEHEHGDHEHEHGDHEHEHGDHEHEHDDHGHDHDHDHGHDDHGHDDHGHDHGHGHDDQDCHFHAGVEHCVSRSTNKVCERVDRDYNIPLRIGLLFAILAASLVGVLGPVYINRFCPVAMDGWVFTCLKQFGTGVVISTALVHLLTHAFLMFSNSCLELKYEATCAAIAMAGLVLAFLVDFVSRKSVAHRMAVSEGKSDESTDSKETPLECPGAPRTQDKISVLLLESGIAFHSVLVGTTLVVAGDTSFVTLFVVILFHQMFEGMALGSRLAQIEAFSTRVKTALGLVFAVTTPLGMAIGIGALNHFNGNDPATIIALGTLDAVSAGILLWVGLVEMLAHDWLQGPLLDAGMLKTSAAVFGLVAGLALMSFLGKWA